MTTTKNRGVVGFLWLLKIAGKTKNYASSAYVSRRGRSISDSKFRESNDSLEPKFRSCVSVSHRTSENFHPALTETELVTSSEDAIQPIRKFRRENFSWIPSTSFFTSQTTSDQNFAGSWIRIIQFNHHQLWVSWKIWWPDKGRILKLGAKFWKQAKTGSQQQVLTIFWAQKTKTQVNSKQQHTSCRVGKES